MENAPLIFGKMIEVMKRVPAIGKTQRNSQQGFNFRGIDQVMNALQDILPEVGVFYLPEVLESQREIRESKNGGKTTYTVLKVKYTFYAADGSHVEAIVQSEGMDSADKSSNKAMSGACKYALSQSFNIATKEMIDPDADDPKQSEDGQPLAQVTPQPVRKEQQAQAQAAPQAFDEDAFLEKFPGVSIYCTPITADKAERVEDSNNIPYGMITTQELRYHLNALIKSLRENHLSDDVRVDKQFKLGCINAVLLDRKAHPEKRDSARRK